MRNDSMAMAGAGLLICTLTLSAALAGGRVPAISPEEETVLPVVLIELPAASLAEPSSGSPGTAAPTPAASETARTQETAGEPEIAGTAETAGEPEAAFLVALRFGKNAPDRVFLGDSLGAPLEPAEPDGEGDATLGPVPPGIYTLVAGTRELGRFRLLDNAALADAGGQAWTDGEVLHLENYRPGAAAAEVRLPAPGLYSFCLTGSGGTCRADVFVPARERPDGAGCWSRTLWFRGLPAGAYRLLWEERDLAGVVVRPGAVTWVTAAADG